MSYSRGDIYYVEKFSSYGSEQQSGRPAVIVSNNKNNDNSATVEIVYLTTKIKPNLPTHVVVNGTGIPSTALCEQVHTVDMQRLMSYSGTCSKQEMQAIDIALLVSLGLNLGEKVEDDIPRDEPEQVISDSTELIEVKAQLSMMRQMYNDLLQQALCNDATAR